MKSSLIICIILCFIDTIYAVDPEVDMGAAEIINRWGYPAESFNVTTDDGYILTIFRIPHGRNQTEQPRKPRPVVFFMHGLEADCVTWISNLPNQDAAYIYADLGYDVWLGNYRGNRYGKLHTDLSANEHAFWDFSWDEMAKHDLPAMLNFVLQTTDAPFLYYIGHSMGSLTAFAAFSTNQTLAEKVRTFYALAPLTTVGHIKGLLSLVAKFMTEFQWALNLLGADQFLNPGWLTRMFATYACGISITEPLCANTLFMMAGPSSKQINETRMPVYMAHTPAGTSTKNVVHFGQMVHSNKFQKFDYGNKNQLHYASDSAPLYDVTQMHTPVVLYWGGNDWLADAEDVDQMLPLLKNCIGKNFLPDFNHMDFLWGLRAAHEIYLPISMNIAMDFAQWQSTK